MECKCGFIFGAVYRMPVMIRMFLSHYNASLCNPRCVSDTDHSLHGYVIYRSPAEGAVRRWSGISIDLPRKTPTGVYHISKQQH